MEAILPSVQHESTEITAVRYVSGHIDEASRHWQHVLLLHVIKHMCMKPLLEVVVCPSDAVPR